MNARVLGVSLAAVLLSINLQGCQTNPSKPSDSAAASATSETETSADASRTRTEGAVLGAVAGGVLGYALGGNNRQTAAIVGTAVGAGAGYLVGNEIAKRKQKYATEEEFLEAEIVSAKEYNETASRYNGQLRGEIVRLEARAGDLESRYRTGQVSKQELLHERQEVKEQIASSRGVHDKLKQEYEIKQAVQSEESRTRGPDDAYVRQLESEITELKQNMDELHAQSVQLAQIDERLIL